MYGVPETQLSLEEYWAALQICDCSGFGVRNSPAQVTELKQGCGYLWNQFERIYLANAIAKAEKRMLNSRWLGFPIRRSYFYKEIPYGWPVNFDVSWVREVGAETETVFAAGTAIVLSVMGVINEPVVFTVAVTFTDPNELILFYPGSTTQQIRPSSVVIDTTTMIATVEIPRCRLLLAGYFTNYDAPADHPDYEDDANFVDEVDVARNYVNPLGSNLVWMRHFPGGCAICGAVGICEPSTRCGEELQYACGYVMNEKLGWVQFEPVVKAEDGSYTSTSYAVCRLPDKIQANFMAGYHDRYDEVDQDLVRAIIAVAHNNLPEDICGCGQQQRYYKRDRKPIEPAVSFGLGPSTWGIHEAMEIVRDRRVVQGGFI